MSLIAMAASPSPRLNSAYYLHWGVVQISLTNFLIIMAMVLVFLLALFLPPMGGSRRDSEEQHDDD